MRQDSIIHHVLHSSLVNAVQIGVLKDQLHETQAEIVRLKAVLVTRSKGPCWRTKLEKALSPGLPAEHDPTPQDWPHMDNVHVRDLTIRLAGLQDTKRNLEGEAIRLRAHLEQSDLQLIAANDKCQRLQGIVNCYLEGKLFGWAKP